MSVPTGDSTLNDIISCATLARANLSAIAAPGKHWFESRDPDGGRGMEGAVRLLALHPGWEVSPFAANLATGLAPIAAQVKLVSAKKGMNIEGHR